MATAHPFAPEIQWRIAVARRFHLASVESLYREVVRPLLEDGAITLECSYAADEAIYPDYWANRMKLIFELADVHVLLDIEPNANTLWEFQISASYARRSAANALKLSFGWEPKLPKNLAPISLKIRSGAGEDWFSKEGRHGVIHVGQGNNTTTFPARLRDYLDLAKRCRAESIEQVAGMSFANQGKYAIRSSQVEAEFGKMMALFNAFHTGNNVDEIRELLPKDLSESISPLVDALSPPNLRARIASPMRESGLRINNSLDEWFIDVRANRVLVRGRLWECFRETRAAVMEKAILDYPWMTTGLGRYVIAAFVLFAVYGAWTIQKKEAAS